MLSTKTLFLKLSSFAFVMNFSKSAFVPTFNDSEYSAKLIPLSLKIIFLVLEIAITLNFNLSFSFRYSDCWFIWFNNFDPTFPIPITKRLICLMFFSKNLSWRVFKAFFTSFFSITAVMFRSEDPWEMALTLMLFLPSELNIFPLIPWWFFILSPTRAIIERLFSIKHGFKIEFSISYLNASSTIFLALSASDSLIPIHIECSEEACVIIIILMLLFEISSNNFFENPGIPTIPLPSIVTRAIFSIWLIPLITESLLEFSLIIVPLALGSKVFLMFTGIFLLITGFTVGGYKTFAPKCDNSMASLYVISPIGNDCLTWLGFAV